MTRLQRRGRRLHPSGRREAGRVRREEEVPAPVVVLPVGPGAEEPILDLGGTTAPGRTEEAEERSEWNRRLGTLAMSGAAAVSALVLALALGGGRMPTSIVRGGGNVPLPPGIVGGPTPVGPFIEGTVGGHGYRPGAGNDAGGPEEQPPGDGDSGLGGGLFSPGTGGSDEPKTGGDTGGDNGGGDGGGGDGGGGDGGGGDGGGGGGNGGGGGGNDGGNGGGAHTPNDGLPGKSGEHNPHGGPPGQLGLTPPHGPGLGIGSGQTAEKHSHKH